MIHVRVRIATQHPVGCIMILLQLQLHLQTRLEAYMCHIIPTLNEHVC